MSKNKQAKKSSAAEPDNFYLLKLIVYLVLGSFWVRLVSGGMEIPIPLGLIIGLLIARTDRLQIDRKIEYAVLVVAMFVGFWLPLGLEVII